MSTLLFEANADMEDVPDMCIREPVSTHMKCGPMGQNSTVLISSPDTQVYPMAAPDATGDLNDDTGFHTVLPVSKECIFSSGNSVTAVSKSKLHPPSQTWSLRPRNDRVSHFKDFRMSNLPTSLKGGRNHTSKVQPT